MLMGSGKKIILNDFKFGTFTGRFQSDSAACMTVKGLMGSDGCVYERSVTTCPKAHFADGVPTLCLHGQHCQPTSAPLRQGRIRF